MIIKISNMLMAAAPSKEWIRDKVSDRMRKPLPAISYPEKGKRTSFYLDELTSDRLSRLAVSSGRSANEIYTSCLIDVLKGGDEESEVLMPVVAEVVERVTVRTAPTVPVQTPQKLSKTQRAWLDGLEHRRAVIRADIAVGRWGVFSITGGSPAVKPDEPLDAQGVRDFDDEIQQGLVVQELIPWEYSDEEARAWLVARHRDGKPLSWHYISGDSESLNDQQEARRRGEIRADKRFSDMIATLAQVEREEALEREAFGRKKYYLEWAARDRDTLLELGKRAGRSEALSVPKNLAVLAEKAEDVGLLGRMKLSNSEVRSGSTGHRMPPGMSRFFSILVTETAFPWFPPRTW